MNDMETVFEGLLIIIVSEADYKNKSVYDNEEYYFVTTPYYIISASIYTDGTESEISIRSKKDSRSIEFKKIYSNEDIEGFRKIFTQA